MKVVKVERFVMQFEIDVCGECQGFFLDRGEAGRLAGGRDLEKLLHAYAGDRGPAGCPGCGEKMRLRTLKARGHEVTVDVCPKCRGTWLDGKELDRLRSAYEAYLHDSSGEAKAEAPSRSLAASVASSQNCAAGFAAMLSWAPVVK